MVFHRHIRAAIAGLGFRRTHTSCRRERRRPHRLNRSPNEEGKAGQDNEQSPEDQDPHVCNIRRSPPQFKVPSTSWSSSDKDPLRPAALKTAHLEGIFALRRAFDGQKRPKSTEIHKTTARSFEFSHSSQELCPRGRGRDPIAPNPLKWEARLEPRHWRSDCFIIAQTVT
jgi:hypothetical protein